MAEQWAVPMDRLLHNDEWPDDRTGQIARDHNGRRGRYLETDYGIVPASGDGAGGKCRLQESPTGRGSESGDRGRHT